MKCWNRECGNTLDAKAVTCPVCGWDKPDQKNAGERVSVSIAGREFSSPKCGDIDCRQPGTLSESTLGGDVWWCSSHFPPFRHSRLARIKRHEPGAKRPDFEAVAERLAIQREPGSDDI